MNSTISYSSLNPKKNSTEKGDFEIMEMLNTASTQINLSSDQSVFVKKIF